MRYTLERYFCVRLKTFEGHFCVRKGNEKRIIILGAEKEYSKSGDESGNRGTETWPRPNNKRLPVEYVIQS